MQHALWVGAALLLAGTSCQAQQQQQQQQCPADQVGSCNDQVCCCSKGGLISYKPNGTDCKPEYSGSFIACIVLAVATVIITLASGWYFGGRGSLSPFTSGFTPAASRYPTSGGGASHYIPSNGGAVYGPNGGPYYPPINGGHYPPINAGHYPDNGAEATQLHVSEIAGARPVPGAH